MLGLSFYVGKEVGVFEARLYREKSSELESSLELLQEHHKVTERELTAAHLELEMQAMVIDELRNSLDIASGDYKSLARSLVFFEEVFSDSDKANESFVWRLRVLPIAQTRKYEFDLILRQTRDSGRFSKNIDLSIKLDLIVVAEGEEKIFSISELGDFKEYPFQANFKQFFRLNGFFRIPKGFEPERIRVSTKDKGRVYKTKDQEWSQVVTLG